MIQMQQNIGTNSLNIPYFIFFIIRPDGNSAYTKTHEQYPLQIEMDKLLGLISLFSAVNNLQSGIVHPDIVSGRKDQIDLTHKTSLKSLNTTTFQLRVLDTVSGYRFVLMADHRVDSKKIDSKLQQIYKSFVNYIIKAPFFNKVIQKSLRNSILQQISKLNITNAQFYAMLRKINTNQLHTNQTFTQKLEIMKIQIRTKIKQLASNIDLLYHVFDRKIAIIIRKIQDNQQPLHLYNQHNQEQIKKIRNRVKELEDQLQDGKNKYNAIVSQNQYLKNKNIALIQELQILSKKKVATITNDSSKNINAKTDQTQDSLQNYGSPIQQQNNQLFPNNDLTFNKNVSVGAINKKIKSQQNSFSSLLIKQQNSFEPSYGSTDRKQSQKFALFGCMPAKPIQPLNQQIGDIKFKSNSRKNHSFQADGHDESHRLSFLINNLKQVDEHSITSHQTSRYHFSRDESANKSVLSKGVVKKYHI